MLVETENQEVATVQLISLEERSASRVLCLSHVTQDTLALVTQYDAPAHGWCEMAEYTPVCVPVCLSVSLVCVCVLAQLLAHAEAAAPLAQCCRAERCIPQLHNSVRLMGRREGGSRLGVFEAGGWRRGGRNSLNPGGVMAP